MLQYLVEQVFAVGYFTDEAMQSSWVPTDIEIKSLFYDFSSHFNFPGTQPWTFCDIYDFAVILVSPPITARQTFNIIFQ